MMTAGVSRKSIEQGLALLLLGVGTSTVFGLTTPYMAAATACYLTMIVGLTFRTVNRRRHATIMGAAMAGDVLLVLVLEAQRGAVETAVGQALTLTQHVHIVTSLFAVILYIPVAVLGWRLLNRPQDRQTLRGPHLRVAVVAFVLRTIGFVTMFSMLARIN